MSATDVRRLPGKTDGLHGGFLRPWEKQKGRRVRCHHVHCAALSQPKLLLSKHGHAGLLATQEVLWRYGECCLSRGQASRHQEAGWPRAQGPHHGGVPSGAGSSAGPGGHGPLLPKQTCLPKVAKWSRQGFGACSLTDCPPAALWEMVAP